MSDRDKYLLNKLENKETDADRYFEHAYKIEQKANKEFQNQFNEILKNNIESKIEQYKYSLSFNINIKKENKFKYPHHLDINCTLETYNSLINNLKQENFQIKIYNFFFFKKIKISWNINIKNLDEKSLAVQYFIETTKQLDDSTLNCEDQLYSNIKSEVYWCSERHKYTLVFYIKLSNKYSIIRYESFNYIFSYPRKFYKHLLEKFESEGFKVKTRQRLFKKKIIINWDKRK